MNRNEPHHHSRSISFTGKKDYPHSEVPLRPTRSAPSTWKKPRRNVGDTVFITSPSKVYIESTDRYSIPLISANNNENKVVAMKPLIVGDSIRNSKDLPKIRNTIFEESLESQEICFYLADNDSDHHYESLYTTYEQQDDDYDSFESDTGSEKSLDKIKSDAQNNELPKPPNAQPYGLIKFAGKHMKKLKNNFSIDLSKSLSRMTKRMSRTDLNVPNSIKEEKLQPVSSNDKITETPSKCSTSTTGAIYHNVEFSKALPPKPSDEKERIKLTSNLANKRRSTFYLTEVIDIDKNENNATDHSVISSRLSKPNVLRPKSPPPPAPIKGSDQKKNSNDVGKVSLSAERDVIKNNDAENQTFWYAEVGLYRSPINSPSTSTAENSGSNTSYTIKSSDFINQDDEDYYNMKNKNDYNSEGINTSDEKESNKDDSLTNVTPDIQLLLQDEPLYQFYDAAVLESVCRDGVSDIDSDTYEEIDEDNISEVSSNRPSAMELVLPNKNTISFNKTLWCEIPEVTQSTVLGQLSARQKKLQEAKFEIITSEASYLNSLNVLHDHFASNIRKYVNKEEWEILFGEVIAVRTCSERLLQELEKCWQDNILLYGICDIVQKEAEENFYVYIQYCENQILLGDTLKQIMKKPGFTDFLKELESSPSCQFLTLYSFLMLPMQRITRWPLLVDAVLKRLSQSDPEYLVCQYALSSLNKIVNQCNEAARRKEREIELQNIFRNLEFAKDIVPVNIVLPNRWLVRSGAVTNIQPKNDDSKMTFGKRFNKVQLYLYLFNDLFLVTKEKSCGTYTTLHYCPRNLVELNDTEVFLMFPKKDCPEKNLFFLTILENQEGKTLLSCNKESDRERWIEAFTPPKSEDPEETLYECWDCPQITVLHNYSPVQPDELSLSRGDVINVLRKMADGWYHGERIRDGQTGWFPANYTSEIVNPHVRARNLKQRYRLLAFSENYLKSN
ncbi:hypothetical protein NQ314_001387 [Rhamnusium bicolor]|uniref:Rho guanine nucleotide exchange factor 26 n=1 Tax=Rhamnusium bicolor TaxID=1586634 RepID=A0AAV8ZT04_9CUCU|nr:hypothetical protein NQ314_001387 [Rhamnusium bicolor]